MKRRCAKTTSLEQAAFFAEQQGRIQINQRRPDGIFLAHKDLARLRKQFQRAEGLASLSHSSSQVGQALGVFISHAHGFKKSGALAGGLFRFLAQVEVQINFRKVHVAEREVVLIVVGVAGFAGVAQHVNGPAIFAAQIVEPGDVVVGLRDQHGHAMALAPFVGLLVARERAGKIVERDLAGGHVAQDSGDGFGVWLGKQLLIGTLIAGQGLSETILAMVDVADVDIQARQPPAVSAGLEDAPGFFSGGKGFIVLAEQQMRLDGGAQSAGQFIVIAERDVNIGGAAMIFNGELVFAHTVQRVRLTAKAVGERVGMIEPLGNRQASLGKSQRLGRVGAKLAQNQIFQVQNGFRSH